MGRYFPEKLIPPGINDERSRAVLGAFEAMASEFDFSKLLMRSSSEMPTEVLQLAIAENSLAEFIDVDGSPEEAVRTLIDNAFPLHEQQGTDGGVLEGLEAFGLKADIEQWYELEPIGPHDTHTITVDTSQDIFGDGDIWAEKVHRQIWRVVDAQKRWSQDTALRLSAGVYTGVYAAAFPVTQLTTVALPFVFDPPIAESPLRVGVVPHTRLIITASAL
jgi:phage tail P2-like protein